MVLEFGPHACQARTSLQFLFSPSFSLLLQLCLGAGTMLTFKSLSLAGHSIVCAQTQCLGGKGLCEFTQGVPGHPNSYIWRPCVRYKGVHHCLTNVASLNPSLQPGRSLAIPMSSKNLSDFLEAHTLAVQLRHLISVMKRSQSCPVACSFLFHLTLLSPPLLEACSTGEKLLRLGFVTAS